MSELVDILRKRLELDEDIATDEEILAATKGTFLRACVEAGMAMRKACKEILKACRGTLNAP